MTGEQGAFHVYEERLLVESTNVLSIKIQEYCQGSNNIVIAYKFIENGAIRRRR